MATGNLLNVQPAELRFLFELRKQSSCTMLLTNKTDKYVAFKVKTTSPKKYCVRPNSGITMPGSTCNVTVTMQAQKELPLDMQCRDKFLVQSVVTEVTTAKEITADTFNKQEGKVVEEFKFRVVYVRANLPSPVPEESDEGSSPGASLNENGSLNFSQLEDVSKSLEVPKEKSSAAWSMISKLTEEKASAILQNQRLQEELELLRNEKNRSGATGYSMILVALIGLLGVLTGYFLMGK